MPENSGAAGLPIAFDAERTSYLLQGAAAMAEGRNQASQQSGSNQTQRSEGGAPRAIEPQRSSSALAQPMWPSSSMSLMRRLMSDMDRLFGEFGWGPSLTSQ